MSAYLVYKFISKKFQSIDPGTVINISRSTGESVTGDNQIQFSVKCYGKIAVWCTKQRWILVIGIGDFSDNQQSEAQPD